jgi:hypothetical protein
MKAWLGNGDETSESGIRTKGPFNAGQQMAATPVPGGVKSGIEGGDF